MLVTMNEGREEIPSGGFFARDGWIEQVGPSETLPTTADRILDLGGHIALPGLINTHHHFYQTLTRAIAQDAPLFEWLTTLYPIWARMTPDDIRVSTKTALLELAMSGCTTSSDHLYLFPNGSQLEDEIEPAQELGMRFHAAHGSMSLGQSDGGLPPDSVVETADNILTESERLILAHHDPTPGALIRIVLAPCSPFSVTPEVMRESAALARRHGIRLHTHLAETKDEEEFCIREFGSPPLQYAEDLDWAGHDVWFAHAVHPGPGGVEWMARTGCGVAHCPSSNMRLASGIAPVAGYLAAGVPTGLGVDGSASNDGGQLLGEARQAMLLARVAASPGLIHVEEQPQMSARTALEMATLGGAAVLGRDDIGSLEPGKVADFAAYDLDRIEFAGARHDPVAALLLCAPVPARHTYVHGLPVISDGRPVAVELESLLEEHHRASRRLIQG
jgi:cytosine/adenosine deaminase-related metal-dependent hydrolase